MKRLVCFGFALLLTTPLYAETFSWVDDSGTYNFTEDYASVPKKYRKKVKRREDVPLDEKQPSAAPVPGNAVKQPEKGEAKPAAVPGSEKELFGGKSRAEWRKEMDVLEAELSRMEKRTEQLKLQINTTKVSSRAQFDEMLKEYNDSWAAYQQKYKVYSELLETIRKAGLVVEINK